MRIFAAPSNFRLDPACGRPISRERNMNSSGTTIARCYGLLLVVVVVTLIKAPRGI
jgi:hypothetical protein